MRWIHLSDLHLGKRVNEYSMLEDQKYILEEILGIVREEEPEAVVIAGDVYDKSVPPAEAVTLFDDFLNALCEGGRKVLIISGNHDSAERLTFGGRLMERSGVYLAPVYDGCVEPVRLPDEFGEVRFYLLPFVKPMHVRAPF
ncbi:MAG: exonuclease subunit SbcD, partial [Lachnospiraceae bacterium]|nr:exonuclease subunit SbcD [Lachnospiraceae bacterium]